MIWFQERKVWVAYAGKQRNSIRAPGIDPKGKESKTVAHPNPRLGGLLEHQLLLDRSFPSLSLNTVQQADVGKDQGRRSHSISWKCETLKDRGGVCWRDISEGSLKLHGAGRGGEKKRWMRWRKTGKLAEPLITQDMQERKFIWEETWKRWTWSAQEHPGKDQ